MYFNNVHGQINLQATLSAQSAGTDQAAVTPHHPITCNTQLDLFEDGSLGCEHVTVGPGDHRTQDVLNATIAILLIECAMEAFWNGWAWGSEGMGAALTQG